jgi:hypothetical protein
MTGYQLRIMLETVRLYVLEHPESDVDELIIVWHELEAAEWPRAEDTAG